MTIAEKIAFAEHFHTLQSNAYQHGAEGIAKAWYEQIAGNPFVDLDSGLSAVFQSVGMECLEVWRNGERDRKDVNNDSRKYSHRTD